MSIEETKTLVVNCDVCKGAKRKTTGTNENIKISDIAGVDNWITVHSEIPGGATKHVCSLDCLGNALKEMLPSEPSNRLYVAKGVLCSD